jgi:hypothetical protein
MFDKIFSNIGNFLGKSIGGSIFSTIGRVVGNKIGEYLDDLNREIDEQYRERYILDHFILRQEIYGLPIPIIFGKARTNGKIIWTDNLRENSERSDSIKYFNSGVEKSITHNIEHKYFLSFALGLCEGEIQDIVRVWIGNNIIDLSQYKFRLYKGSSSQLPDPLIEKILGNGLCPAFRDLAYIVFEDLPLEEFNNNIPNFSFEVLKRIDIENHKSTEDLVSSIILIPGSGEYVYDTKIQYKHILSENNNILASRAINYNSYQKVADSIAGLNQLEFTCKNIRWVAPVVSWFTNSTNIAECSIFPATEFKEEDKNFSEKWQVQNYNRSNAKIIGKDENGDPRYGGTINDISIIRYLDELRRRNFKIMFYPMIFVDLPQKPWRGNLTGSCDDVNNFFNKQDGYNNFIIHYANLVKGRVDAFIIGSELVNITNIKDTNYNFPTIPELINLARRVKNILGPNVKISYAADWSEYHHTDGGYYHLDQLWGSDYIDFIGIDAYFPLTDSHESELGDEEIARGFNSGAGYDFYYDGNNEKKPLDQKYAWKNIEYWWSNKHYSPDGKETDWVPKSKKIWFTEFGFPSLDKATNQPNIFFDPKCINGGIPKYSSSETDFAIQKRSIKIAIEYFQKCHYLENYFLWTWDARPWPAWPYTNTWKDSYLWEKGHWVNNKLGAINLGSLLITLCQKAGIDSKNLEIRDFDDNIEGIVFEQNIKIIDAINLLRITYLFDIDSSYSKKIRFVKRGFSNNHYSVSTKDLAIKDDMISKHTNRCNSLSLSELSISYLDHQNEYIKECYTESINDKPSYHKIFLKIPISISLSEIKRISKILLHHTNFENEEIEFYLPLSYIKLSPTDILLIKNEKEEYRVRVISIRIKDLLLTCTAIFEDKSIYKIKIKHENEIYKFEAQKDRGAIFAIELPFINKNFTFKDLIYIGINNGKGQKLYAEIHTDKRIFVKELKNNALVGIVTKFTNRINATPNLIDNDSFFHIYSISSLEQNISESDFLSGKNLAMIGDEIISYESIKKIGENLYIISKLIRGLHETSKVINEHKEGEKFVIINSMDQIEISNELVGKNISFFIDNNTKTNFLYRNLKKNIEQIQNLTYVISENLIKLSFKPPIYLYDNWQDKYSSGFLYKISLYNSGLIYRYETKELEIKINIADIDLSSTTEIAIIAIRQKDSIQSQEAIIRITR